LNGLVGLILVYGVIGAPVALRGEIGMSAPRNTYGWLLRASALAGNLYDVGADRGTVYLRTANAQ
jgi:hypothetical protein